LNRTAYKYFAFISYSRKDSRAASWLQRRLEWFRVPLRLVKEGNRPEHPKYIRPVFRDKTDLEVSDEHFWNSIKAALDESRFLIVLCSPASAKSEPVNLELKHFLNNPDRENACGCVIPVILEGMVNKGKDTECLCPALRDEGAKILKRNLPSMIADEGESERDGWKEGFVGLVSFLLALEKDTLGRYIQRQERKRALWWLVSAIVVAIVAVLAVVGWLRASTQKRKQTGRGGR
jgi:hypothetical protein